MKMLFIGLNIGAGSHHGAGGNVGGGVGGLMDDSSGAGSIVGPSSSSLNHHLHRYGVRPQ